MKEIKPWKELGEKTLFNKPWLTARVVDMQLPNGNRIPEYYLLDYPDWICTIAITKDNKFVFVRQYRPGIKRVLTELCAGVSESFDATKMVSAQRELMEETGYGNGKWEEFMTISCNPGTHTNLVHCFVATDVEKVSEAYAEDTEDLDVVLLSRDEVMTLLNSGEMFQAVHAAALWKFMATR